MTDLFLQNLENRTNEGLVQVLSNEKPKLFGEQKFHENKGQDNWLGSRPFAGSMLTLEKPGGINKC